MRRGPGLGLSAGGQFGRNDGGGGGHRFDQLAQPLIVLFQLINLPLNVEEEAFLAIARHFRVQPIAFAPVRI
jgi:hypothetical protein